MEITIAELQKLGESEDHIEFKEAKHNYTFAGGKHVDPKDRRRCVLGYIVALANEKGGRLVLGMADHMPHAVVGSDFAENEVGELTDEIYERLGIRIEATELYEDGACACTICSISSDRAAFAFRGCSPYAYRRKFA